LPPWADLAAQMDAGVDSHLGDSILYSVDGTTFLPIAGFVYDAGELEMLSGQPIDPNRRDPRVKINRNLIPKPGLEHRLRHPRIGPGTWRPTNVEPDKLTQGRYWLFDVERVSAS
jgi:hypothetical protein